MNATIRMDVGDNVVTCLRDFRHGDALCEGLTASADIPIYHKAALRTIHKGEAVVKYGQVKIGRAHV